MDKIASNKSIKFRIRMTFIIMIITTSITFIYSNVAKNKMIDDYNKFMKINVRLSDLSLKFNSSWLYFDSYMKNKDSEIYEKMIEANEEIDSIINEVSPYIKFDTESSIYFRNLTNMNEWFQEQTNLVIQRDESNLETYEQYMKIRTMNYYISQHSRSLISSFLQYTESYYSEMLDKYKLLDTNLYFLLVLTIFINVILLKVINDDILITLANLSTYAKQLSNANWDIPDIKGDSYKELDDLTDAFNHMKKSINLYINELNEKAELERNYQSEKIKNIEKDKVIRETQLNAMQMQINPHFLFNNLNTVSRMAMFEGAEKTVELVDSLSKILRFNLTNKENLIRLEDEINIVKAYILIQKIKYEDRMCFDFNIDEELNDLYIPPMIIQLLIENAIKHGFSGSKRNGCIITTIRKVDEYVQIAIKDNGNGIEKDELELLLGGKAIHKKGKNSTGLGIKNISNRLELYFGRKDLLNIVSEEGIGTKVEIMIPIKESEKIAKGTNS